MMIKRKLRLHFNFHKIIRITSKVTNSTLHLFLIMQLCFHQMPEEEAFTVLVRIMQEYRFLTTFHNDMQEKRARCPKIKRQHKDPFDSHPFLGQSVMKIYNPHNRMREMFKPSMAELGLCMYQVSGCTYHHGDVRDYLKS